MVSRIACSSSVRSGSRAARRAVRTGSIAANATKQAALARRGRLPRAARRRRALASADIEDVDAALDDEGDAEEGDDHSGDGEDDQPGQLRTAPAAGDPEVQRQPVDEPADERPGLDRIPGPVGAPEILGPDGARGDHD